MKNIIITSMLLMLCFASPNCAAGEWTMGTEWSKTDIALESAYLVIDTMDMFTTMDIKNHQESFEQNSILGSHPTDSEISRYFAVGMVLQLGIADLLPAELRRVWIVSGIVVEILAVRDGLTGGLKMQFQFNP